MLRKQMDKKTTITLDGGKTQYSVPLPVKHFFAQQVLVFAQMKQAVQDATEALDEAYEKGRQSMMVNLEELHSGD